MGWNLTLKTDYPVTKSVVEQMLPKLPPEIRSHHPCLPSSLQSWGWSLAVDLCLEEQGLWLSGSYSMSGHLAAPAAKAFKVLLEEHGYQVQIEDPDSLLKEVGSGQN